MKIFFNIVILIIIILIAGAIFVLPKYFLYTLFNPHLKKIYPNKSVSGYAVMFNQGALQGDSEHFGVVDESKSEPNLIILGPLSFVDISLAFQRIVVSSDGSVAASESLYRPYDQDWIPYWLAYDFKNSISYGGAFFPIDEDPNLIGVRGKVIQELIQSRGGIGQEFSYLHIYEKENKLSIKEWKRWQKQIKAKKNCKPWTPADANEL